MSRSEYSRENAEIHRGHVNCKSKIRDFLFEFHLPLGILPLESIEEFGFERSSGFMWVIHTKNTCYNFKKINQQVSFQTEISGFVDHCRMWNVVGVKTKVFFMWLGITDLFIDDNHDEITFVTASGLSQTFPINAFDPWKFKIQWPIYIFFLFCLFACVESVRENKSSFLFLNLIKNRLSIFKHLNI